MKTQELEVTLECSHVQVFEFDLSNPEPLPAVLVCEECGKERTVEEVDPQVVVLDMYQVSESAPAQTSFPGGTAYTAGEELAIVYDPISGEFGYFFAGISQDGIAYESETVMGFSTFEEAVKDAMAEA